MWRRKRSNLIYAAVISAPENEKTRQKKYSHLFNHRYLLRSFSLPFVLLFASHSVAGSPLLHCTTMTTSFLRLDSVGVNVESCDARLFISRVLKKGEKEKRIEWGKKEKRKRDRIASIEIRSSERL